MFCDDFKERYDGLPVAIYAREWRTPLPVAETNFCHNHSEVEMVSILEGAATLHINEDTYAVKAGDVFFVSPYDLHYTEIEKGATYVNRCICFDTVLLRDEEMKQALENGSMTLCPVVCLPAVSEAVLHVYDACNEKADGWRMEVQGWLLLLFATLKKEGFLKTATASKETVFCKQVLAFLQERYADAITSADAARALFLSQGHFCRQFKANFGDSFSAYLRRYRLEKSLELLCETAWSVTDVARAVGFDDPCYYTKSFRETFGESPRTYRQKKNFLV